MGYGGTDADLLGAVFVLLYFFLFVLIFAYGVTAYILGSVGLSAIADRRGIRNHWLAWVPFGNLWILGSISDQFKYLVMGKVKNRRKTMLALSIVAAVLYSILVFSGIVSRLVGGDGPSLFTFIVATGFYAVVIILIVLQFMCYFDLFFSCDKDNCTLFLVLSVVIVVVLPFLVFACRKKDGGMPPRKQPEPPAGFFTTLFRQMEAMGKVIPEEEIPGEEIPLEDIPGEEIPVEEIPLEEPPAQPVETVVE